MILIMRLKMINLINNLLKVNFVCFNNNNNNNNNSNNNKNKS